MSSSPTALETALIGYASVMNDITRILSQIESGDSPMASQLLTLVYDELRKLAARKLAQEKLGHTLQATALVHEAYLRLVESSQHQSWENSGHFFAAAAEAMRRILVENARRKKRIKHGGDFNRIDWDEAALLTVEPCVDLLDLDNALRKLEAEDPIKAEVVKLRFFAGMTMPEIAESMKTSLPTVERHWTYARTWLFAELKSEKNEGDSKDSSH